jgi:hypothetical protein
VFLAFCDSKVTGCGSIRAQVVRDELVWDKAIFPQKLAHQFERRPLVASGLGENVEHFTLGIHGTPEVGQAPIDLEIDLIKVPGQVVCSFGRRLRRSAAILGPKWFTQRRTVSQNTVSAEIH